MVRLEEKNFWKIICPTKKNTRLKGRAKSEISLLQNTCERCLKQSCFSRQMFWWNFQTDIFFHKQYVANTFGLFSLLKFCHQLLVFCKNWLRSYIAWRIKQGEVLRGLKRMVPSDESMDSNKKKSRRKEKDDENICKLKIMRTQTEW